MNFIKTLTRDEMKNVMAGGGPCRIAVSDSDGNFLYWSSSTSYEDAQGDYASNEHYDNGTQATGYCCQSCGEAGFSSANPT